MTGCALGDHPGCPGLKATFWHDPTLYTSIILLALLLVLLFVGLGLALRLLWILAVFFLVFWDTSCFRVPERLTQE